MNNTTCTVTKTKKSKGSSSYHHIIISSFAFFYVAPRKRALYVYILRTSGSPPAKPSSPLISISPAPTLMSDILPSQRLEPPHRPERARTTGGGGDARKGEQRGHFVLVRCHFFRPKERSNTFSEQRKLRIIFPRYLECSLHPRLSNDTNIVPYI